MLQNKSTATKQSSGSFSSTAATPVGAGRRAAHMGGIAAGTQPGSIHGHQEEPDIDMPEPDTLASDESDSDEAEGNNIYYPSKSKGGRCILLEPSPSGPKQDSRFPQWPRQELPLLSHPLGA